MPLKCYEKPDRLEDRPFSQKDLERIAGYVASSGVPVFLILFGIAGSLGLGFLVCRAAEVWRKFADIGRIIAKLGGLLAGITATRLLFSRLLNVPGLRFFPGWTTLVIAGIVILGLIQKLVSSALAILDELIFVDEIAAILDQGCDYIRERF